MSCRLTRRAKRARQFPMRLFAVFALGLGLALAVRADRPVTNLTSDEVLARFIERSRSTSNRMAGIRLVFVRRTTSEQFDAKGQVVESRSKEQRIELRGMEQEVRLLRLNGRAPSVTEADRESEDEGERRKRYTGRGDRSRRRSNVDYLDEKLIRRFDYEVEGVEEVDGRKTYRMRFRPGAARENKEIADKVLGLLNGRIWIDAEEFELVKLEARLSREFTFWGGVIASLDKLDFDLRRQRLDDGTWVNLLLDSRATGRKVLSRFDGRMRVEQEGFRRLPLSLP